MPGGESFLGDDGNVWGNRLQSGDDDLFRSCIGFGDGAMIVFILSAESFRVNFHDCAACSECQFLEAGKHVDGSSHLAS